LKKSGQDKIQIIVVDNASTDNSVEVLKIKYPDITLLECKKNYGYAEGCNKGADIAEGDYLIFLNNDTIHDKNWIKNLVNIIEENPNFSSVQPKIKNYINKESFDYAGGCGGELDIFCYPFTRGRIFNTLEKDFGQYDNTKKIFWASGTAFITRKSIFKEVNGFDRVFFAHMEEIDYHWKCHLIGYDVGFTPNSVIYHKGGQTLNYSSSLKTYLNHRNSILLMSNYSIFTFMLLIIPKLFLELISSFYELFLGRYKHSFAIIKSLLWIFLHPNIVFKRIINISKLRKINDFKMMKYFYCGSVVIRYFIFRKKKYSSL
tara:strand:+ start:6924 stop:7874 length:951 start_codon:yes stop_codon:yes gene_type:complete